MREVVEYLFGAASFVPHGFCLLWRPDLVAMHALSDGAIAASYFSIPMALAVFVRRRVDLEYKWVFRLFAAFIVACGTTHLVGLVTLWQPVYGLQGLIKVVTAGLSVITAFLLWPLIPKALALPSPSALREANAELEKALIEKDRALGQIGALLDSAPDATIFVDRVGTIVRTNRQTERLLGYSTGELINAPIGMLLREPYREHFFSERATGLGTEPGPFAMTKDGRKIPVEISRSPIETDADYIVCVALRDVTERKRAEERQNLLVAELDHRVKNVLATLGAVVSHTQQERRPLTNFVAALEGRISSMGRTHELLSSGRWRGVSLPKLVRRELAPYITRNNTEINGPEVVLGAEAGQAMAMVLHELTTNAAKYGALSTEHGRVAVRWDRRPNGHNGSQLVLEWQEIGGPPVAPGKPSYGTSTIRDLIPYEFGGVVDLVLAPEGVRCRLEIPADWLRNDGEAVLEAKAHV
jgi:PAS domain S-box-containing protein